jgi:hypothetical protein
VNGAVAVAVAVPVTVTVAIVVVGVYRTRQKRIVTLQDQIMKEGSMK